jgi:hypothetical protein
MLGHCRKHLEDAKESYAEHLLFALCFGGRMIAGGLAVVIHAIFPAVFETTGSRILCSLYDELQARGSTHACPEGQKAPKGN